MQVHVGLYQMSLLLWSESSRSKQVYSSVKQQDTVLSASASKLTHCVQIFVLVIILVIVIIPRNWCFYPIPIKYVIKVLYY